MTAPAADHDGLVATMPYRPLYVIKLGSATLAHPRVFDEIADLRRRGARLLIVLGGASHIAEYYASIGRTVRTLRMRDDGEVRYCPPEEMAHVAAAYDRLTLPRARAELTARGLTVYAATAHADGVVTATANKPVRAYEGGRQRIVRDHRAGVVSAVDTERLDTLLGAFDTVCLSAPVAADDGGGPLNVDADVLAAEIARALAADHLRLVTGTAGLLRDPAEPASTLPDVVAGEGMRYAAGRMRQKVRAAELALTGVTDVAVTGPHTLSTERGSRFWRAPAPAGDLELLARAVEISSVSGDEAELAEYLVRWCIQQGIDAKIDPAGNLVATRGTGERRLLLVGHLDTVPFRWPVRWEPGDTLTGRGCVDAKAPLTAFLTALAAIDPPHDATVQVIGTVEEERGATGAMYVRDNYPADAVIVGEPSGSGAVTVGYHGVLKARLSVAGTAAHTAGQGVRTAASVLVDALGTLAADVAAADPEARWQVLSLDAGSDGSAQHAHAVIDIRVPPGTELADLVSLVERAGRPPVHARVLLATPAVLTGRTDPLARAFIRAIRTTTGDAARILSKKGSSDMNTLATTWRDVSMVAYGPGDAGLDHTPHERIDAAEWRRGVAVVSAAVRGWLAPAVTR